MKFSQYDIIQVPKDEKNGYEYEYVKITFPCKDYNTDDCWLVDAIPCNVDGDEYPEMEVGEPTLTDVFITNITGMNVLNELACDECWD